MSKGASLPLRLAHFLRWPLIAVVVIAAVVGLVEAGKQTMLASYRRRERVYTQIATRAEQNAHRYRAEMRQSPAESDETESIASKIYYWQAVSRKARYEARTFQALRGKIEGRW